MRNNKILFVLLPLEFYSENESTKILSLISKILSVVSLHSANSSNMILLDRKFDKLRLFSSFSSFNVICENLCTNKSSF